MIYYPDSGLGSEKWRRLWWWIARITWPPPVKTAGGLRGWYDKAVVLPETVAAVWEHED